MTVRIDDVGNMSGTRAGRTDGPPVLIGSHIDTVVRGGKYRRRARRARRAGSDRALNDLGIETERPVAMVNWTNEEGVRFEPAMTCSGAGRRPLHPRGVYAKTDRAGLRFEDELRRIGYLGDEANRPLPAAAYLELHIEQGPVLEAAGQPVGVVGGIVGITWSEVTIRGQADHAGPSPMHLRHDALVAAAHIISRVERLAIDRMRRGRDGRPAGHRAEHDQHDSWRGRLQRRFPAPRTGACWTRRCGIWKNLVERVCAERGVTGAVQPLLDQRADTVRPKGRVGGQRAVDRSACRCIRFGPAPATTPNTSPKSAHPA